MQGKGTIKFFTMLIAVACLYQLSFTWIVQKVESNAKAYAKGNIEKERFYLDSIATEVVYPVFRHNYQYCKERALALGLDLKGGMNVTMQVSVDELLRSLAGPHATPAFNQALTHASMRAKNSQKDYVTLFTEEYEKLHPRGQLATLFASKDNQKQIPLHASNARVKKFLRDGVQNAVDRSFNILRTRIDKFGVSSANIQLQQRTHRILIELPGVFDPVRVRKLLQGSAKLEFYKTFDNTKIYPILSNINHILAAKNKASSDTSVSSKGASSQSEEPELTLIEKIQKEQGKNAKTSTTPVPSSAANPLFSLLSPATYSGQDGRPILRPGPLVGYAAQRDTAQVNAYLRSDDIRTMLPPNLKLLWGVKPSAKNKILELYAIQLVGMKYGPVLSGEVITHARSDYGAKGPEVTMIMNAAGARKWKQITAEAAGKLGDDSDNQCIAIVLDDQVYSAPSVSGEISGGISSISGNFTIEDTKDLANILKAGRLPVPAHIVEETVVGPSLGQEAIHAGLISCIIGLVLILLFMIVYYHHAGIVANLAVFVNIFFLMGVFASIGAILTLPGIAGIVLTLGIAVDANVLIYERIREELRHSKHLKEAVNEGYKRALSSILDANITTFLTGLILYIFGSGPVLGFATTLMIGIATSLFTSVLITRAIFEWLLQKNWQLKFARAWSTYLFKKPSYQFVQHRLKFYIFSGLFILAGLISIFLRGFSYSVDFKGGRTYIVRFDKAIPTQVVRTILDRSFGSTTEVKTFGADRLRITTAYLIDDDSHLAETQVLSRLKQSLSTIKGNKAYVLSSQKVGPTVANDIKIAAVYSILFALIIIAVYILIRFQKWQFSIAAMLALVHDALFVLSCFSLFNGILPFSLDIDQAFIAAILTVIGYSINDTVVVFDRIREYLSLHPSQGVAPKPLINDAINSTLSRTIITALTVVFVLVVLLLFGGEVIRGFSFALLIGVIFGTYSSICIAAPSITDFWKKS